MKERAGEFSGPEGRRAVYNHAEPKDKRCCGCVGTERETVRRMDTQREGKWERLFFLERSTENLLLLLLPRHNSRWEKKIKDLELFTQTQNVSVFFLFFSFLLFFFKFYLASISCVFLIVFIMIIFLSSCCSDMMEKKNDSENETEMIILFISGELAAVIGRLAEPFGSPGCSYGQLYATR